MIESKVLGKSYRTKVGYKSAIKRYEDHAKYELKLINDAIRKGWKTWLGDPIAKHRRGWEVELIKIEKEKNKLLS